MKEKTFIVSFEISANPNVTEEDLMSRFEQWRDPEKVVFKEDICLTNIEIKEKHV